MNSNVYSYNCSGNNIINNSIIQGDVINSSKKSDVDWKRIEEEIRTIVSEYSKKYNDAEDLKYLNGLQKQVQEKNTKGLKKYLDNIPTILIGFIQKLGPYIIENILK